MTMWNVELFLVNRVSHKRSMNTLTINLILTFFFVKRWIMEADFFYIVNTYLILYGLYTCIPILYYLENKDFIQNTILKAEKPVLLALEQYIEKEEQKRKNRIKKILCIIMVFIIFNFY
jgi:hypothetical protein